MENRILREKLVEIYGIEITFFDSLVESGLVKCITEEQNVYLAYEDLESFERFANWHYDLEVNMPGLEIISHLLKKIEHLQDERRTLMNRMFSATENWEDFDEF